MLRAIIAQPLLFGTGTAWFKKSGSKDEIHQETIDAVKAAIDVGYRNLDGAQGNATAWFSSDDRLTQMSAYGTEREIGIAMKESGIPRSEFFLTTKLQGLVDAEKALEASLEKLQTDYVDLYVFILSKYVRVGSASNIMQISHPQPLQCHIPFRPNLRLDCNGTLPLPRPRPPHRRIEPLHPKPKTHPLSRNHKPRRQPNRSPPLPLSTRPLRLHARAQHRSSRLLLPHAAEGGSHR